MGKVKRFGLVGALALGLGVGLAAGEAPGPVPPGEADRVIETIFEQGRQVNRLQADLTTQKTGGRLREGAKLIQFESVRLAAPNRMWLENRGQNARERNPNNFSLLIVDGQSLWDVQPVDDGKREVSRSALREDIKSGGAADIAAVMLLFLGIDREVRTARELRDYYRIDCVREPVPAGASSGRDAPARPGLTYHFTLRPLASAPDGDVVELWYQDGSTLPWQVRTTQRQQVRWPPPKPGEPPRYTVEETLRFLRNVRTNRDGLPAFGPEAFRLPLSRNMVVTDAERDRVLTPDEVQRLLDAAARR